MKLEGKKILVTGADGFIGSHLTEALVKRGCRVRAFVQYNSFNTRGWLDHSPEDIQKSIEFFPGDIRDPYLTKAAMKGCQVVFHLAALISIPYSYLSPQSYVDTNVTGTLHVLQAARELELERIIHTSTSEVYGTAQFVPISEEHPLQGQSPYAATKIGADQLALSFYRSFSTPVAIIRPFNTYGPRQSARAVIPTIICQILQGAREISLGALSPTRDFNYIFDTVAGFIGVAQCDEALGKVVNIGSGYEISIEETVQLLVEMMGRKVEVKTDITRLRPQKSEVERLWADIERARTIFSYTPRFGGGAGLRKGLEETVKWFSEPKHLTLYQREGYVI